MTIKQLEYILKDKFIDLLNQMFRLVRGSSGSDNVNNGNH